MNKFQKTSSAIAISLSVSFSAGSLWGPNTDQFPLLQVMNDNVIACWTDNSSIVEDSPCLTKTGGWWFGYTDYGASTHVYIEGSWVNFGEDVSIANVEDGSSLIPSSGLQVRLTANAASSNEAPSTAGIRFDHKKQGSAIDRWDDSETNTLDISSKEGYCITYSLIGDNVRFELGWDEDKYGYDTWYATLPVGTNRTVNLKWPESSTGSTAEDFKKENWGFGDYIQPITTATTEATGLRIKLRNVSTTNSATADFTISELGWLDECSGSTNVQNPSSSSNETEISSSSSSETETSSSSSNETETPGSSSSEYNSSSSSGTETPIRLPQIAKGNISVQEIGSSIFLENLPTNTRVELYNLQGERVYLGNSGNSQILKILIQTKGIYIAKVGKQTFRVAVR